VDIGGWLFALFVLGFSKGCLKFNGHVTYLATTRPKNRGVPKNMPKMPKINRDQFGFNFNSNYKCGVHVQ
jgi:hypothetical protein